MYSPSGLKGNANDECQGEMQRSEWQGRIEKVIDQIFL